ncbi:1,4-dihydroxy-2-naphthoate octaprenyltransferase [Hanstruepera neustonica]|uniref:1,4-dihydroxy-2-naphthoate octaprenyltransferase n=1 Tax=Hanstruepera neustonica TaxID=1445657 RepID=A0A2K1DY14_9FLAO|nr:1,4-dihydroxy-2-naphthoate octaprenyltransferase [Hanstruepera neustonica]PNQ72925.1 1,4-dihydroxy-2-naphthoate octaprenyltransferase [Hanstruepera neustonica]
MSNFKHWVSAARLRTLPLSVSGIILAGCFAEYNGFFNWIVFALAILTTLSLQILSNFANDYGDGVKGTDNNQRIGPERAIQSGKISPSSMYNAIKINILITIALAFFLILAAFGVTHFWYAVLFFVLGGISIYASIKYTIGDDAYGYKGLGDLYVFVFFGLVSVLGGYFLFSRQIDHVVILPAAIIGLLSVAVLNLNNLRDIESDLKSNKITIAVRLGFEKAKKYHYFLIFSAMVLSLVFAILYYTNPFNFIFLLVFIPLIKHLKTVNTVDEPALLDPELKKVALSTFFMAVLMSIGYLI